MKSKSCVLSARGGRLTSETYDWRAWEAHIHFDGDISLVSDDYRNCKWDRCVLHREQVVAARIARYSELERALVQAVNLNETAQEAGFKHGLEHGAAEARALIEDFLIEWDAERRDLAAVERVAGEMRQWVIQQPPYPYLFAISEAEVDSEGKGEA